MAEETKFAIPEADGLELCKALGLAINNISMYGLEHSVTTGSVTQAFDLLVSKSDLYGAVEFVCGDMGLLINGNEIDTVRSTGQLLVDQLTKLGVHDFEFTPPVSRPEFNRFMSILCSSSSQLAKDGGFEEAVAKARLKSVRVQGVSYARVDRSAGDAPPPTGVAPTARVSETVRMSKTVRMSPPVTARSATTARRKSFDLDLEMGLDELGGDAEGTAFSSKSKLTFAAGSYLEQKHTADKQREELLELIRSQSGFSRERKVLREELFSAGMSKEEWDELLLASGSLNPSQQNGGGAVESLQRLLMDVDVLATHGEAIAAGQSTEAMAQILDVIGKEVAQLASQTKGHVVSLAERVDADRETVAKIEGEARARGIGIELSREELLASLAEINQELAQPLSAASAVIDVLEDGKLGEVSEAQQDVLRVASEGMKRLEKLVSYLTTISGQPEGLSPDKDILNDAYKE